MNRIVERFLAQWEEGVAEPGQSFVTVAQASSAGPAIEAYSTGSVGW
jgi:hypothetical protein